ncbi:MAG: hypothetical protein UV42_C0033G0001, partial [Candidatus Magasanikbacteria bacterium GW2011_GWE2_42_7]
MHHRLPPLLVLSIVLLQGVFLHSPLVGVSALCIYVFLFLSWSKRCLGTRIYGAIVLLTYLILANALVYYFYGTTNMTSFLILAGSFAFFWIPQSTRLGETVVAFWQKWKTYKANLLHPFRDTKIVLLTVTVAFLDTTLLGLLWSRRTIELMPSPWQAVTVWFFIIFTISTILLIYAVAKHRSTGIALALVSLHLFTIYTIA